MPDSEQVTVDAVAAQNVFSEVLELRGPIQHRFTAMIGGDIGAGSTVTVQWKRPGESVWKVLKTYTALIAELGAVQGSIDLRIGVATGDYVGPDSLDLRLTVR